MKKELIEKMKQIYNEFGIDIHSVPHSIQSEINDLVKEIIRLRKLKTKNGIKIK